MLQSPRSRRAGFTLVELLVVIGIIALLISILLPALNKARESARQVKCMSNMQQIAKAVLMFANENKGRMPTATGSNLKYASSPSSWTTYSGTTPMDMRFQCSDWLPWRRAKDPFDGTANSGNATIYDMNITYGPLTKHLGGKVIDTTGDFDAANNVARNLDELFRCPSDPVENARTKYDPTSGRGAYRYSYSYNVSWDGSRAGPRGEECEAGVTRQTSNFTGRITSIKKPGEKILIICEDEQTVDDNVWTHSGIGGVYNSTTNFVQNATIGALASRHENKRKNAKSQNSGVNSNVDTVDARGNVAMTDGHVEFMGRKQALYQRHTGNVLPDDPAVYALRRN